MNANVVHELPVLVDARGRMYSARVLGALADDGTWDGAIEFLDEQGRRFETGTETRRPSLTELIYWSTALTRADVEEALARAKAPKASPAAQAPRAIRARRPVRRASAEKPSSTRSRSGSGASARPR